MKLLDDQARPQLAYQDKFGGQEDGYGHFFSFPNLVKKKIGENALGQSPALSTWKHCSLHVLLVLHLIPAAVARLP